MSGSSKDSSLKAAALSVSSDDDNDDSDDNRCSSESDDSNNDSDHSETDDDNDDNDDDDDVPHRGRRPRPDLIDPLELSSSTHHAGRHSPECPPSSTQHSPRFSAPPYLTEMSVEQGLLRHSAQRVAVSSLPVEAPTTAFTNEEGFGRLIRTNSWPPNSDVSSDDDEGGQLYSAVPLFGVGGYRPS